MDGSCVRNEPRYNAISRFYLMTAHRAQLCPTAGRPRGGGSRGKGACEKPELGNAGFNSRISLNECGRTWQNHWWRFWELF